MKVLSVEDDPVASMVLGRILTDRGYEVTACVGNRRNEGSQEAFYPLIFLDLLLPGRLDGFSFADGSAISQRGSTPNSNRNGER